MAQAMVFTGKMTFINLVKFLNNEIIIFLYQHVLHLIFHWNLEHVLKDYASKELKCNNCKQILCPKYVKSSDKKHFYHLNKTCPKNLEFIFSLFIMVFFVISHKIFVI